MCVHACVYRDANDEPPAKQAKVDDGADLAGGLSSMLGEEVTGVRKSHVYIFLFEFLHISQSFSFAVFDMADVSYEFLAYFFLFVKGHDGTIVFFVDFVISPTN